MLVALYVSFLVLVDCVQIPDAICEGCFLLLASFFLLSTCHFPSCATILYHVQHLLIFHPLSAVAISFIMFSNFHDYSSASNCLIILHHSSYLSMLFMGLHGLSVVSIIFHQLFPCSLHGGDPTPYLKAIRACCNKAAPCHHHVCSEECLYKSCCLRLGGVAPASIPFFLESFHAWHIKEAPCHYHEGWLHRSFCLQMGVGLRTLFKAGPCSTTVNHSRLSRCLP